jgi:hypothetical protein
VELEFHPEVVAAGRDVAHAERMEPVLAEIVKDCWTAMGLFWLEAAVFFAVRLDAPPGSGCCTSCGRSCPSRSSCFRSWCCVS